MHGFGLASQYFFSRPLAELKLQQIALLVAMVKGPSYYNPRRQPERALERRNLVINLLAEQGIVDEQQAEQAKKRHWALPNAAVWLTPPTQASWI